MVLTVERLFYMSNGTFGLMFLDGLPIGKTCERPWLNNKPRESCIPEGEYLSAPFNSHKHGETIVLQDVPARSSILVHSANFPSELEGCIAVGKEYLRNSKNEIQGVSLSRDTMRTLRALWGSREGIVVNVIKG